MNRENIFTQVLLIFHQSAMLGMGKIKNPATDKLERNLEQAKHAIDILEVLKEKTRGNLTADESKLLDGITTELRLNYIDESSKG